MKILDKFWGQFTLLIRYFQFDWATNEDVITDAKSRNGQEKLIQKFKKKFQKKKKQFKSD